MVGVIRYEPVAVGPLYKALDGKIAVDGRHHDVARLGREGAVDGHQGVGGYVRGRAVHARALDAGQVGRVRIGHQQVVQVDFADGGSVGQTGDAGRNGCFALDEPQRLTDDLQDFNGSHNAISGNEWAFITAIILIILVVI